MRHLLLAFSLPLLSIFPGILSATVPLKDLVRHAEVEQVKISPTGSHIAIKRLYNGERVLVIRSLETKEITGTVQFRGDEEVGNFIWANDERVVAEIISRRDALESPVNYGSLYAINADGTRNLNIFGFGAGEMQTGSRVQKAKATYAHATIIDRLNDDKDEILISTRPWARQGEAHGDVFRLNIYTGVRKEVVGLPQMEGRAYTDGRGNLIFANGTNADNTYELYRKSDNGWELTDHPLLRHGYPAGYDNSTGEVYLIKEEPGTTDSLVAWNREKQTGRKVFQHPITDISGLLTHPETQVPLGVYLNPDYPTAEFFAEDKSFTPFYRGLRKAFEGYHTRFTSFTRDGKLGVLEVSGDRLPGDYFLVNLKTKKVDFLTSSAPWLDPNTLNPMRAEAFQSTDGLRIGTYLTFPNDRKVDLPMIVMPHGGPHARDYWGYDRDAQILSQNGYLVLQVNFRGSTGYGDGFLSAGERQWGRNIQRDIAEAVQWAVTQGYADRDRICIYGASFGGYSAMMNPIRYPDLYQCAAGYAGVYDLELLYKEGDVPRRRRGVAYLNKTIGESEAELKEASPLYHTDALDLPLFIVHGEKDERAPVSHAEALLEKVEEEGKSVQSLIAPNEGHGFYSTENNLKLYTELLTFFDQHIGVGAAE